MGNDTSQTKPETQGQTAAVVREIKPEEGKAIVAEAATWAGTPYKMLGGASKKGVGGDCSGTTAKIYFVAGFPYTEKENDNVVTSSFQSLASGKLPRFRKVTEPQAGDVLFWSGHMAIYVGPDLMWTAFNPDSKHPYAQHSIKFFRGDKPTYYRYLIYKGEAKW